MMSYTMLVIAIFCTSAFGWTIPNHIGQDDGPLILTPLIKSGKLEEARNLSKVDPSLFAGVESYAAYMTVNSTFDSNTFFWFFPAENASLKTTPWIIWLQGGPGGSSLYGLFTEIGPIYCPTPDKVERMPTTWGSDYSLLFIDNPVGTGFSFTDDGGYATDQDMVGAALLNFTQQFVLLFPELQHAPLFIAGESYAGKYIPTLGHYLLHRVDGIMMNLKGLIIGDGFIDPPTLLHYSELVQQTGLQSPESAEKIHQLEEQARKYWDENNFESYAEDFDHILNEALDLGTISYYNYLKEKNDEISNFEIYLNKPDVQTALHTKKIHFTTINYNIYDYLHGDMFRTVKPWLEELMEYVGVLCFNGQLDVIVGYALSLNTYRSLEWSGAEGYLNAIRKPIMDTKNVNKINSYVRQYRNFWEAMVRNAGHMVPADQPEAAKQLIDLFIQKFK